MELNTQVEMNILSAAEKVFYRKGKDGTSMQDIADEANITRTSLNYYYRSKDKLFEAVFRNTMEQFVPKIYELVNSGKAVRDFLPALVEIIIDTIIERPQIPVFVLQELSSNPERLTQVYLDLGIDPAKTIHILENNDELRSMAIDPRQLIMNVISMCIFPFAAKPLLMGIMFGGNEGAYIAAMKERKVLIPLMIENMIKSNKQ